MEVVVAIEVGAVVAFKVGAVIEVKGEMMINFTLLAYL